MPTSPPSLDVKSLRVHLLRCGYTNEVVRTPYEFGALDGARNVPLAAFSQEPLDTRSACIAAVEAQGDPMREVAHVRPLGAPVVFVLNQNDLQWWEQTAEGAVFRETVQGRLVESFFSSRRADFAPSRIYRAKTRGRFEFTDQLTFVDVGLMPLVEGEVGEALGRLVERLVRQIRDELAPRDVTEAFGQWLFQSVFWLLAGKILKDKGVRTFADVNLTDPGEVFLRVARHYNAVPVLMRDSAERAALTGAAVAVGQFAPLNNVTTESLAYVYENTLISETTRAHLGTHSTPTWLVDYVLWRLAPRIEQIDPARRQVFEPACGHAAFLVAAARTLRELHPAAMDQKQRLHYLRRRIHGIEVDDFAREIGRLSLTLADIPNPDGWDLRAGDMFRGRAVAELASSSMVLLANPPFEKFDSRETSYYRQRHVNLKYHNKTGEVLNRAWHAMPRDAVFGVVIPQSLLINKGMRDIRSELLWNFEIDEICLLPDKVFAKSDAESALLIGAKRKPTPAKTVRYALVRDADIKQFRLRSVPTFERVVPQSSFLFRTNYVMRVPELEEVWIALQDFRRLVAVAEVNKGLEYKAKNSLGPGARTIEQEPFDNAVRGYDKVEDDRELQLHGRPTACWMSISPKALRRAGAGTVVRRPQVLMSYARVDRGPWRLKAVIDRFGHAITSRFIAVRPKQGLALELIWAVCNSPIANAYAFAHLGARDNLVATLRQIPFPEANQSEADELTGAAKKYLAAPSRDNLLIVDSMVLRLYRLDPRLEIQLLAYFVGAERKGLPFAFGDYFAPDAPPETPLSSSIGPYRSDGAFLPGLPEWWPSANRRRVELIDKELSATITAAEQNELVELEQRMDEVLDRVAPLPQANEIISRSKAGEATSDF